VTTGRPNTALTNIVLTGFMGTGKTTVGRALADKLGFEFADTDAVIVERHGPIADIFAQQGEDSFRAIERDLAAELADRSGLVVSTGGRMMLDPANAATLGARGRVFCLAASVDELHRRIVEGSGAPRPLLAGDDPRARIEELLAERAEGYGVFPQVDTDGRSPTTIADDIIARLDPPTP
jgi:shikimate kinase